jgi:hypothetical protein
MTLAGFDRGEALINIADTDLAPHPCELDYFEDAERIEECRRRKSL